MLSKVAVTVDYEKHCQFDEASLGSLLPSLLE